MEDRYTSMPYSQPILPNYLCCDVFYRFNILLHFPEPYGVASLALMRFCWVTFSVCLACSAERVIGAISLALDSGSHRLKARLNILSLALS